MARDELCMRITRRIVEYEGETEVLDPPLYEAIDVDALEQLIRSTAPPSGEGGCVVSFAYSDYTITVDSGGTVDVTPRESGSTSSQQPTEIPN